MIERGRKTLDEPGGAGRSAAGSLEKGKRRAHILGQAQ